MREWPSPGDTVTSSELLEVSWPEYFLAVPEQ